MPQPTPEVEAGSVSSSDVVVELGRVLGSRQFARASRSRDFLAYVVTETLAGREERLSERTVARWALGRGSDFTGKDDASVRVRANRVRRALDDYYADEGAGDPVRVVLPLGRYVPRFERTSAATVPGPTVPGVAVVSLESSGEEPASLIARFLTETLVQHLAQHGEIRVVGPVAAPQGGSDRTVVGGVRSVLTGHVTVREGQLALAARLVDSESGGVLWTTEKAVDVREIGAFEPEESWSREIASALGDATGVVVREEVRRVGRTVTEPDVAARLAFYSYIDRGTASSISEAVPLLDAALEHGDRTPTLLAMRAALANAASIYGIGDREVELDRAESLAREALALDGSNAHAHLVLGSAARDRGLWDVAVTHAEEAMRLAPYRPSYLVGAGITLSGAGQWQRGSDVIRRAHRLHPGLSGHTHAWLAMGHLVEQDYARALVEASLLPSEDGYVWGPLYRAMALSGLGHPVQAKAEADKVRQMRPEVLDDLPGYLSGRMRLTDDELTRLSALL